MKQREYAYDNFKFLLVTLVAAAHFADLYSDSIAITRGMYGAIVTFVMPAFVFVSGLFSKKILSDRKRAAKKIVYYIVLYVLCKLFLAVPSVLLGGGSGFDLFSESGIPWYMLSMALWYALTLLLKKVNVYAVAAVNIVLACLLGYTDVIGDFLCLSKTVVFYPFFFAGYHLDAGQVAAALRRPGCRAVGVCGIALLVLTAVLCPDFLFGLRPLLSGRGGAYSRIAYPQYGALYRLAYYAAAAFLVCCLLSVISRKETLFTKFGARTLQVYFLHYYLIYAFRLFLNAQRLQALLPEMAIALFILLVSTAVAAFLSLHIFSVPFSVLNKFFD